MIGLTRKQVELLSYIETYMAVERVSPSFEEMASALGLKSKSGVHRMINGLIERGYLRQMPYRARALEIVSAHPIANPLAQVSTEALVAEINRRTSRTLRPVA